MPWLSVARLVVLPELTKLSRQTETELRAYVERGGRLLIAGPIPKVDGQSFDRVGVRIEREPWQDHIYLPAWCCGRMTRRAGRS